MSRSIQIPDPNGFQSSLSPPTDDALNQAGVDRGLVTEQLRPAFRSWEQRRGGTRQLGDALDGLWGDAETSLQRIALHCLTLPMRPPWAPPSLLLLERMARGEVELDATPTGG